MKPLALHQLGEQVQASAPFTCPESGFKRGALVLLCLGFLTFGITWGITQPDLTDSPVLRLDGYVNLMVACDYVPGNYLGGMGWMGCLAIFFWSIWAFYARAKLSAEEGLCSDGVVTLVTISGWAFVCLTPFGYLWFEVHPSFDNEVSLFAHLQGLVAIYVGCAQWFLVQWIFARAVLPSKKHGFSSWTAAVWAHTILTVIVCYHMEANMIQYIRTKVMPPLPIHTEHGVRFHGPHSLMQLCDLCRWASFFYCVFGSVLDGWSPIAPWQESDRGGATFHGRKFPPYVKVPEKEEEALSASIAKQISEYFEENYDQAEATNCGSDEDWGATIANLKATFEIDKRIEYIHPDLRVGFLKQPAKYEAQVRVSLTTLAWARMAVRVNLPDAVNEKTQLLKPQIQSARASSNIPASERGLMSDADDQTHKVADFLLQEDLKEYLATDGNHLVDILHQKHKPKGWGQLRYLWHQWWNGTALAEAKDNLDHQMIRTSPEGRLPNSGIFGKRYYGGLPFRLGPGACKWGFEARQNHDIGQGPDVHQLRTVGKSLSEFHAARNLGDERYKHTTEAYLKENGDAVFDFVVQVATDEYHDLLKASAVWPEDLSPYIAVGTLTIHGGQGLKNFDDGLVFSPWNNLKEHRPLGPLNNARHDVYKRHSNLRTSAMKQCPVLGMAKRK